MSVSYFLATPGDGRQAWLVKRFGVATEAYLSNDPSTGSFTEKLQEAKELHVRGETVIFPR